MSKTKEIKLKVAEAHQDDVDKGIVRIDSQSMRDLNINPGDVVELEGHDKHTVAIAARAYPRDVGINIVRMDGLTRHNAGTSLGELIKVKPTKTKEAKKVVIAPMQKGIQINFMTPPTSLKRALLGRPVVKGDIITLGGTRDRRRTFSGGPFEDIFRMLDEGFMGMSAGAFSNIKFIVVSANPRDSVIITDNTDLVVKPTAVEIKDEKLPEVTYEDIGGLKTEITKIREMVELPLKHPELFSRLGISAPKGVLLYGPPGTGKTLLAKAVANESSAHFVNINGPEVMSKWVGEAEKKLRKVFTDAAENAPTIIFIDEIDSIAPKRSEVTGEVERRVVAQLLASMDGLEDRGKVIVIAATNRENSIDPALRRPGRFDREIEIGVPGREGRLEIFKIHTRNMPLSEDVDIKKLSNLTHGFVGADIEAVCKEAAMLALRRYLPEIKQAETEDDEIPHEILQKIQVTNDDFKNALKMVQPSAMREVMIEIPNVKWDDVGGLEKLKAELKESVEWPLKYPNSFKKIGIKPPRGIMMYGPPGTGKTLLAKAVANESEANFISVKGPELISKWVGESEKAVREIFRKARQVAPSIIFFDEIDSIAGRRGMETGPKVTERVVNQILTEMDGLEDLNDVVVIAATNRPDMVDEGLLRPGRFDKLIYVPSPDKKARKKIFEVHTKKMPLGKGIVFETLAGRTEGYSGADIQAIVREAGMMAIRKNKKASVVEKEYFEKALKEIKPSISKETLEFYKDFEKRFKQSFKTDDSRNYFG